MPVLRRSNHETRDSGMEAAECCDRKQVIQTGKLLVLYRNKGLDVGAMRTPRAAEAVGV